VTTCDGKSVSAEMQLLYGPGKLWRVTFERQLRRHIKDGAVSNRFIQSELRFFEVKKDRYQEPEAFEKKFLELKRRM
jgi:hypothetical protein